MAAHDATAPPSPSAVRPPPITYGSWLILVALWAALVATSLAFSVSQIQARNIELMREGARNVVRTIVAARQWNSEMTGVYAAITDTLQPNPYLRHPRRDIASSDGTRLTLVNPAYMTRLIGKIISANSSLSLRTPSLKPLNPQNAPDDWEAVALLQLEQGGSEVSALRTRTDGSQEFRYIAPLIVTESCLQQCHAQQNYQIGDIRGGISIGQNYAPAAALARSEILQSALRHLLIFALFAGMSYALLAQFHRHWHAYEQTFSSLLQSEKMASLGRLVAGFAHELNTPIGIAVNALSHSEQSINAFAQRLGQNELSEREVQLHLNEIRQSSQLALSNLRRASSLVQGFKGSSIDMAHEEIRRFNLTELIDDVLQHLSKLTKPCAEIEVLCPPDTQITGIPGLLDQIFTNLFANSVMHGFEEGKRTGHIRIEVEPLSDERLLISFADDGVGMPPEVLAKVFEPFFTTRRSSDCNGLGLYICYNLVTVRLGGSIRCDSLPNGGTHFLITLPISLNQAQSQ